MNTQPVDGAEEGSETFPRPPDSPSRVSRVHRRVVIFLVAWMLIVTGLVTLVSLGNPVQRAVLGMAWGLILLWIFVGGFVMRRWRSTWCRWIQRIPLPWQVRFVIVCTVLALTEEAVTTLMTNSAPLYGLEMGQAYITASADYPDVVLYHSVVMFVPMFIAWAVMLRWWRFTPFSVFLLFGVTGTLAEAGTFGLQNLGNFPFWIFVYGLMIWIPASAVTENTRARPPKWWHYPLAVVLPFLFVPLAAVLSPWLWLTPPHPPIHFPPITSG